LNNIHPRKLAQLLVLILFVICPVLGQQVPVDTISVIDREVRDTLVVTKKVGDLSVQETQTIENDSLLFYIEENAMARKADSLWLDALFGRDRFEEMYSAIQQDSFPVGEYDELPTELLKQRLAELNARTPFNVEYNPSLERVINTYLKNRRKSLSRLMGLSHYYFPMFEEELARQGLPLEMKYLAIVESALDPRAKSRVGATGLWQFMFSTGKLFDLDVNSYVDERSDPIKATRAACSYLKQLHKSLGDWDLALAAYNSGPGNVSKAIRRSGGHTNYWNIRHNLPRETAGYVPAFLATMYIFEFAEEHGFNVDAPSYPLVATDTVHVKKMISLEQVARATGVSTDELSFLNPSYIHGIIPVVKDKDYTLRLPVEALGTFVSNEETVYGFATADFENREKPLPKFFEQSDKVIYRVRSGDYLGKIANRYGVSVRQIKRWNHLRSNRLRIGQRLSIYPRKLARAPSPSTAEKKPSAPGAKYYTVRSGDSLWSISKKFPGVTVDNIRKWNDISGNKLKPGMKLKIQKG